MDDLNPPFDRIVLLPGVAAPLGDDGVMSGIAIGEASRRCCRELRF